MRGKKVKQLRKVYREIFDLFLSQHLEPSISWRGFKRLWSRQVLARAGA